MLTIQLFIPLPLLTLRRQHWKIIEKLEASKEDQYSIASAYDKLAEICAYVGDTHGATQARQNSKLVLMSSPVDM